MIFELYIQQNLEHIFGVKNINPEGSTDSRTQTWQRWHVTFSLSSKQRMQYANVGDEGLDLCLTKRL